MASEEDLKAQQTLLREQFAKSEKVMERYRQTWTSLHNELQQSLKDEADERRKVACKQMNMAIEKRRMEAETAASSKHKLVAEQEMDRNIRGLEELQIADVAAVDALKPLCSDKTTAEREALRKEAKLVSKFLSLDLQHCPTSGILSAVYTRDGKSIPYHVVTTGRDPCDIADELWKFDEECSTKK
ncbi:kinetochore protein Spc24-like [Dermacentor albipictus]|uniref:kinetochore protein Spc24-like n=1 Tax=Dermacentor albipictus TaxID=60249 RepID=UPI0031FD7545